MNPADNNALLAEVSYRQEQAQRSWPRRRAGESILRRRMKRVARTLSHLAARREPRPTEPPRSPAHLAQWHRILLLAR